jgi:hypothetical protein
MSKAMERLLPVSPPFNRVQNITQPKRQVLGEHEAIRSIQIGATKEQNVSAVCLRIQ